MATSKSMKKSRSYQLQRKSPQWLKKRMEILDRDGHKCVECGSNTAGLHVHHLKYVRGRKVWEYGDEDLITLCRSCHGKIHLFPKVEDSCEN